MGGAPCRILVHAIMMEFTAIPSDKGQLPLFDARLREVFKSYPFNQSVVNETTYTEAVCLAMKKKTWSDDDREELWEAVRKVCGGYS
jgi:hypothetical protein